MANCAKNLYTVSFTDKSKSSIYVSKGELITDKADIAFVGKTKRDYGAIFNENVLHLLEHFACPESPTNPGNPDLSLTFKSLLERPIEGQVWYNTTVNRAFRFNGTTWDALASGCDVAGNYGVISHGQQLPHPVCPITGYVFQYEECSWIVSPFSYDSDINFMQCYTDANAVVTMQYRPVGGVIQNGMANYQIVGIRGNINEGGIGPAPSPAPGATPTPTPTSTAGATVTPTMTVTPGSSSGATPTPTPTHTPTTTVTPSNTPAPGSSMTPTPTADVTPTPGPTGTPASTPGPTQSSTPAVTPPNTPASTPPSTPPNTPASTPDVTPTPSPDTSGYVTGGTYSCKRTNSAACITLNSNGSISSAGCNISGNWTNLPFRSGENGSNYTFSVVQSPQTPGSGVQTASGPSSGNFGSNHTWCLSVSSSDPESDVWVYVTITGPAGTGSDTVLLKLFTVNSFL